MKANSSTPESLLRNNMQSAPANLPQPSSTPAGERSLLHNAKASTEIRSNVARRYMHMLRGHDRARLKVLSTYPSHT
ncbi:MAG TPA: hypothetical protein VGJ66_18890 [Pyrinomonadaceae bacterium]|jgi:hypothetical protein